MYDVLIIGGGPAGMTAAIYALRNGKSALVIEKNSFGGQITYSPKVENYPGTISMSGNEFAERTMEQIIALGAEVEFGEVVSIENGETSKVVKTKEGDVYEGLAIVLATGVRHRLLGLEGEQELIGNGISFCAVCDGDFYTDKTVCVAGGGNSALQEAILLTEKCKEVIILQDLGYLTGEAPLQEELLSKKNVKVFTNVEFKNLIIENGELTGIKIRNRASGEVLDVSCDGLFIAIGLIPENEPFAELADLNSYGYFDSDERCLTKTPGIFVAGDCRSKSIRQVTTACADGAVAALAASRYIEERRKG